MSYVKTVKILDDITISKIDTDADNMYSALRNGIHSITGWEIVDGSDCKFRISPNLEIYFDFNYISSKYRIAYHLISTNSNGTTSTVQSLLPDAISSTSVPLYICYCKSKSGSTIAFDIKISSSVNFAVVVAEDANGDYVGIGLNTTDNTGITATPYVSEMTWKGYKCYASGTNNSSYKGQLHYLQTGDKVLTTSLCKLPNYLSGCLFKELYMILSCPQTPQVLWKVVLDVEGKKYQGITFNGNGSTVTSCAILAG